ncbi:MAG: DUF3325 family protein [Pseudomonadota bacterium]
MTYLFGLLVATLGMLCIAAAQSKQAKLLLQRSLNESQTRTAIWLGSALLVSCAWQCVAAYGLGIGLTTFFAHACFAAWLVAGLITWRRSRT